MYSYKNICQLFFAILREKIKKLFGMSGVKFYFDVDKDGAVICDDKTYKL